MMPLSPEPWQSRTAARYTKIKIRQKAQHDRNVKRKGTDKTYRIGSTNNQLVRRIEPHTYIIGTGIDSIGKNNFVA
jgi:hypothetical protein